MKLSIVIPVYQVEKYLPKCLDSCINQTLSKEEYEIICINDGSKDRSADILRRYELLYPNLHVITQTNQGLSMARNNGLKKARGEYIWFVDSDDWIEGYAVELILEAIEKEKSKGKNIDIIQLGFRFVFEDSRPSEVKTYSHWENCISGAEYMSMEKIPAGAQFNIYRRKMLIENALFFKPGILHEDIEFKPRVIYYCKNCLSINTPIYNYLQRVTGSIMNQFKLKNALDLIMVMDSLYNFALYHNTKESVLDYYRRRVAMSVNFLIRGSKGLSTAEKDIVGRALISHRHILQFMMKSSIALYKIEGFALWLYPKITFKLLSK